MGALRNEIEKVAVAALGKLAGEIIGVFVIVALLLPVFLVIYLLMKRAAARRGVNFNVQWNQSAPPAQPALEAQPIPELAPEPTPWITESRSPFLDGLERSRSVMVKVYKALLLGGSIALLSGAFYAGMMATAANGLALVAMMLFVAAVAAFAGMWKYDRKSRFVMPEVKVSVQHADPEVHFMAKETISRARQLAQQGMPLDAICRNINPPYAQWDVFRQKAFQKLLETVLKHEPV